MKLSYSLIITILFFYTTVNSQQMPFDFENTNQIFTGFSGSGFSTRANPQNNSDTVGQFFNDGKTKTQGFFIDLVRDIDLDENSEISLSFFSFDGNAHTILVKLENGANANVEIKQTASGSANNWQTLNFDFSNASGTYSRFAIFIDIETETPGTYLLDDITDGTTATDPNVIDVEYTDLVWQDEFNTDGAVDNTKWFHQTFGPNGGRWYNNELQHYTDSQSNSFVSNGNLQIVAKKETKNQNGVTLNYTSARLNSKYAFTYGRVDVRAKLPAGNGTWPAIWTLGKNVSEEGAYWQTQGFGTTAWPDTGEIDIMEHGLHSDNEISSALHTRSSFGNTQNTRRNQLSDVVNDFHVYSLNWSPEKITFLVDGVGYYSYNKPSNFVDSNNDGSDDGWPFDIDQFLLINIAMGGFSGTPDANFTQTNMVIDYVRVYQKAPLSTSNIFADKFSMYPNPASNFIKINTSEKIDKLELYSTLGQIVLKQENSNKQLSTAQVKPGLYLLKIFSNNKTVTKKILITK